MEALIAASLWLLIAMNVIGIFGGWVLLNRARNPRGRTWAAVMMVSPALLTMIVLIVQVNVRLIRVLA